MAESPHYGLPVLDPNVCYAALRARDERFDGRFFVAVTSTRIYCRPVCPAGPPKFEHCRFYPSAAAAQAAGYRPCLRCRPETAPELAVWRGTSNTVSRALSLIAAGDLDADDASVEGLAERLGVGARQLRRLFERHLGASPLAVAQTRRVLFAKQLIHETHLPMSEVALASGFGSVRRFNEIFQRLFARPPSALRRRLGSRPNGTDAGASVTLRLGYRPPYDWDAMIAHLEMRAVTGVEQVESRAYRRAVGSLNGQTGIVGVMPGGGPDTLVVTFRSGCVDDLTSIVGRVRKMFDLAADVDAIGAHLACDPGLASLIESRPGLRIPGAWSEFEVAVRAVLGQQVTLAAARRLVTRLVELCADGAPESQGGPSPCRAFPGPEQVIRADLSPLGMPASRRRTLAALAEAAASDPLLFQPSATLERTIAKLRAIRGIGEWTAHYIALRAAREPDAFPASDCGLLRGAARCRLGATPAELLRRAERWRPWRGYAAQHLWAVDAQARAPSSDANGATATATRRGSRRSVFQPQYGGPR
ncbi:MAG: helix-turn-helix domain-containing protein [Polyangiaceae bacterium]|nr:helix-turn-helix domain-containing protein [Polyangiaceae bacterium]